jgi:hypothetical protein
MSKVMLTLTCLSYLLYPTAAPAWGYQGHKVVGSIADQLLKPNAKQQVRQILGFDLRTAAPWADCVKSVVRHDDGTFHYEVDPNHLEFEVPCTPFNSREERARIVDYTRRNWFTCSYKPDGFERGCHNTFHFEDIAIQRNGFDRSFQGTNDHDVVAAIGAAIAVLSDKPVPPAFSIKDKKEALFMLAHFMGDLHQRADLAKGAGCVADFHRPCFAHMARTSSSVANSPRAASAIDAATSAASSWVSS